jgi:hypothetical protein
MTEIIREKQSRRRVGKLSHRSSEPLACEQKPTWPPDIAAIIRLHFALVAVRWNLKEQNFELYEKLGEVLEISRPFVEESAE